MLAKIEPIAELCCDESVAEALGLHGLSEQEKQVVTAALLTKPVSPSEAACIMTGIPIIHSDVKVTYIDVKPLSEREISKDRGVSFLHDMVTPHYVIH
jgi:hypothetical protein